MMSSEVQCSNLKTITFFFPFNSHRWSLTIFYNPFQECIENFAISDQCFTKNTSGNCRQVDETGVGQQL